MLLAGRSPIDGVLPVSRLWNQECTGNFPFLRGQYRAICFCELRQMTICDLPRRFDPRGKMRHIMTIVNKRESRRDRLFQTKQQRTSLADGQIVSWRLGKNSNKT